MSTFEQCWRRVLLNAPEVPVFLARAWVQQAFDRLSEDRPWVWQRKEILLPVLASRSVTITVTQGSTTVTSTAGFVASDLGRQLRTTPLPLYTITAFTDTSTVTLDNAYTGASGSLSATILDAYVLAPADFGAWLSIQDPTQQRLIPFDISRDELDRVDPQRTTTGDPVRALVPVRQSMLSASLGRLLFEWWPYPSTARSYPALYRPRPALLADADPLPGVLFQRSDLLVTGALMECAKWPGTTDRPNPYFNLSTYRVLAEEFNRERIKLALRDDDQLSQDWVTVPNRPRGLTVTDIGLRSSDATVVDYW